jgi:sec-independent protein translocase protein TatC
MSDWLPPDLPPTDTTKETPIATPMLPAQASPAAVGQSDPLSVTAWHQGQSHGLNQDQSQGQVSDLSQPVNNQIPNPIITNNLLHTVETALTPMLGHLVELRGRLLWCVGVTLLVLTGLFAVVDWLPKLVLALAPTGIQFIQISPGEAFLSAIKLNVLLALVIASPVWLYHTLRFVIPGLHPQEKSRLLVLLLAGSLLFLLGSAMGLWLVAPASIGWLLAFGESLAAHQLSIGRYLDFMTLTTLCTGVAFELPLVLIALVALKLVPKDRLLGQWRQGLIGVFVASAILTPGQDPFSMILLGGGLSVLFALSLWVIKCLPD